MCMCVSIILCNWSVFVCVDSAYGVAWCVVWCGVVWCGMVWYGMVFICTV